MDLPDDLDDYLRGGSALSRQYGKESAPPPPHALDRRVLRHSRAALESRQGSGRSPCMAPLAFAASVLLSVALVLAMVFGPQAARHADDSPHLIRVAARTVVPTNTSSNRTARLYAGNVRGVRAPSVWLADIAALRRAGRNQEAAAEYRRFRSAYPDYPEAGGAERSSGALVIRP